MGVVLKWMLSFWGMYIYIYTSNKTHPESGSISQSSNVSQGFTEHPQQRTRVFLLYPRSVDTLVSLIPKLIKF